MIAIAAAGVLVQSSYAQAHSALPGALLAAYSFNEGSGVTAFDSAGDHDGGLEGGVTWTEAGRYGGAIDLDGTNDKVSVADAAELDLTESFTIESWVAPDTGSKWRPVISKATKFGGPETAGYALFSSGGEEDPEGYSANGSSFAAVGGSASLELESWTHLALSSDGETLRLYVEAEEVDSEPAVANSNTAAALEFGHVGGVLNSFFNGRIDEIRLYDEALSAAQIETDRNSGV